MTEIALALSGESVPRNVAAAFAGVGLLRSEYVVRRAAVYITQGDCQAALHDYVCQVCRVVSPAPVWYRFIEMDSAEVNVMAGCDCELDEKVPILGLRGVRRAMFKPKSFDYELDVVRAVAREHSNLSVLVPYVTEPDEMVFVQEALARVGFPNEIGMMVEIPAAALRIQEFLDLGIRRFVVGANDLSSLVLGTYRSSPRHDLGHSIVLSIVRDIQDTVAKCDGSLAVAGYHTRETMAAYRGLGIDELVLHYSQLPELLSGRFGHLPDLQDLHAIKADTRRRIRAREVERWRQALGNDMSQ